MEIKAVKRNIKGQDLEELIEKCNFVPNSNYVVVTINQYEPQNGLEIVTEELDIMEWQYVVAAGKSARYEAGDKVYLNLLKFVQKVPDPNDRMKYINMINVIPFELNGEILTIIDDNSILGKEENKVIEDIKA